MLADLDATVAAFVKVLPRDYAAVLKTRQTAVDEGSTPTATSSGAASWR